MKSRIIWIGLIALFALTACDVSYNAGDMKVDIEAPSLLSVGETYEVLVSIENPGETTRKLTSIDIYTDYLAGIDLLSSSPAYSQAWDFEGIGFWSYDYHLDIEPGDTLDITYTFQAQTSGDYEGDIDVCIDTEYDCIYNTVQASIL